MRIPCETCIIQCSTPFVNKKPLYQNIFRGEPAISKFDRHITPNHKSSHRFAALTSSGLFPIFIGIHPAHGQLTWFRVYPIRLTVNQTSLSLRLLKFCLIKPTPYWVTHRFILQQARRHPAERDFVCLLADNFRYYFIPLPGCFSPFPHGTCSLSVLSCIQSWIVVDPDSHRPFVVHGTQELFRGTNNFKYTTVTFYGHLFHGVLLSFVTSHIKSPTTPLILRMRISNIQ